MCTDTRSSQLNGILSCKIKNGENIINAIKHIKSVPFELFYFYQDYLGGKCSNNFHSLLDFLTIFLC